jgi:hypothetical protein
MSGFGDYNVEFEGLDMNQDQVQALVKKYKKLKKYQKSSLYAVKTIDGTETIISKLIDEAQDFDA